MMGALLDDIAMLHQQDPAQTPLPIPKRRSQSARSFCFIGIPPFLNIVQNKTKISIPQISENINGDIVNSLCSGRDPFRKEKTDR